MKREELATPSGARLDSCKNSLRDLSPSVSICLLVMQLYSMNMTLLNAMLQSYRLKWLI